MSLLNPEVLQSAMLTLQPKDLEVLQPLNVTGCPLKRTLFQLPSVALLKVLDLPEVAEAPEGGLAAYVTAFHNVLTQIAEPSSPLLVLEAKEYCCVMSDGMCNVEKYAQHKAAAANRLVSNCSPQLAAVMEIWPCCLLPCRKLGGVNAYVYLIHGFGPVLGIVLVNYHPFRAHILMTAPCYKMRCSGLQGSLLWSRGSLGHYALLDML